MNEADLRALVVRHRADLRPCVEAVHDAEDDGCALAHVVLRIVAAREFFVEMVWPCRTCNTAATVRLHDDPSVKKGQTTGGNDG